MTSKSKMDMESVLTLENLTIAIRNGIDREGMPEEQAKEMGSAHSEFLWIQRAHDRQRS